MDEWIPSSTPLQGFCESLRYFRGGFREITYKLPICTGQEEYEDDVDKQEKEIFSEQRVFDPTPRFVSLVIRES